MVTPPYGHAIVQMYNLAYDYTMYGQKKKQMRHSDGFSTGFYFYLSVILNLTCK